MTDTAPIELKLAELSVGDEEARVDPYITPISARAIIPNGVYIIRSSSKANLCLQLNTDDGTNSITASNRDTTYKNLNQQWLLTRQSDNSYRFMNRGRALEMAALLKTCGGDPGSVVGSSEDFFWMLTAFQDAFIIGDPNIAYVVNLTNGGTPTNRVVTLHLFDPDVCHVPFGHVSSVADYIDALESTGQTKLAFRLAERNGPRNPNPPRILLPH
ncbi:hypothetical protein JAAARDRAFT_422459 [Jaapia argillacea MUCL 33604]|uniref:Uncharacterized protein n=1 Tax=Jaapia argillacea MUCL 33604 TaxID=933084 RepID=A0A067PFR9_9AGAM|nr:hypothetical protein JAAARDRAFT_422459 [Jaapia argillacea MUCL 33604]